MISSVPPNGRMWYERPQGTGFALARSGGTMEGPIYLWREPRYPTEAASKAYVDFAVGATGGPFVSLHGGQMRGPLLLQSDPTSLSSATTKHYVDNQIRRAVLDVVGPPAWSTVAQRFTEPEIGHTVMVRTENTGWMVPGAFVRVGRGTYQVQHILADSVTLRLFYLDEGVVPSTTTWDTPGRTWDMPGQIWR